MSSILKKKFKSLIVASSIVVVVLASLFNTSLAVAIPVPSLVRLGLPFCEGADSPNYFPPLTLANRVSWTNPSIPVGSNVMARKIFLPFFKHLGKGVAADYKPWMGDSLSQSASVSDSLHQGSLESFPGSQTSTVKQPFQGGLSDTIQYRIPGLTTTVCQVNSRPKVEYLFTDRVSLLSFLNQMFAKGINIRVVLHRGEQLTPMATGGMAITKIYNVRNKVVKFIYDTKGLVNDYFPAPIVFDNLNRFVPAEFIKTGHSTFRLDTDFVHQNVEFPVRIRFEYSRYLPQDVEHKPFFKDRFWKNNQLATLEEESSK